MKMSIICISSDKLLIAYRMVELDKHIYNQTTVYFLIIKPHLNFNNLVLNQKNQGRLFKKITSTLFLPIHLLLVQIYGV